MSATWSSSLLSLATTAAGANPTAAIVLDLIDGVISLAVQAMSPDLSAELANADAAADAAEDARFPRLTLDTPGQPPIVNLTNEGLALSRLASSECAEQGCISPETALAMVHNALAVTKVLRAAPLAGRLERLRVLPLVKP